MNTLMRSKLLYQSFIIVYWFILISFLVIVISPIDYIHEWDIICHFLILLVLSFILVKRFEKDAFKRKKRLVALVTIFILFSLTLLLRDFFSLRGDVIVSKYEKDNLIVCSQVYSLFMMGNPRIDFTVGVPINRNFLMWSCSSYTKNGLGDDPTIFRNFKLPNHISATEDELYYLKKEGLIIKYGIDIEIFEASK